MHATFTLIQIEFQSPRQYINIWYQKGFPYLLTMTNTHHATLTNIHQTPIFGGWRLEAGAWRLEIGGWKLLVVSCLKPLFLTLIRLRLH